jgi:hypothetical protein
MPVSSLKAKALDEKIPQVSENNKSKRTILNITKTPRFCILIIDKTLKKI